MSFVYKHFSKCFFNNVILVTNKLVWKTAQLIFKCNGVNHINGNNVGTDMSEILTNFGGRGEYHKKNDGQYWNFFINFF